VLIKHWQPRVGLIWLKELAVMPSDPEARFWVRKDWQGRGGWGMVEPTGVLWGQGKMWMRL